ncbi:hypothetical protein D1872_292100 [compost metagenome]
MTQKERKVRKKAGFTSLNPRKAPWVGVAMASESWKKIAYTRKCCISAITSVSLEYSPATCSLHKRRITAEAIEKAAAEPIPILP